MEQAPSIIIEFCSKMGELILSMHFDLPKILSIQKEESKEQDS